MADPVNLNRFRKARRHADDEKRAAENRIAFGRTKAEHTAEKLKAEKAAREHAGKQLDED